MPRNNLEKASVLPARSKAIDIAENTKDNAPNPKKNKDITVKLEPEDPPAEKSIIPNIKQFKFERKPHVKIEYDNESPKKEDTKGLWEPANWRDFLENLRVMNSKGGAPVDSMGCHKTMDENAPPEVMRYQSLIALMLSSQTKDQVTFAAMERLRTHGLTIDSVLEMSDDELGQLIYPVGFWKTKIKYIKKTTETLKEQYNGDIPDSVEKLCKLTGVGPKMAHICMSVAWNKVTGIGVDTHVHRISNRIGWVKKPTSTPEDTRKALQSWLPFELWGEVNHLLVGFGQTICQPISPLCNECLNKDICPSSGMGRKSPNKKSPKKTPVKEEVNEEGSDNDFEVKKENFRSVPKKPSKLKITSVKNDMKIEDQNVIENKSENSFDMKTNERKVTPKKHELTMEKDNDDFEEKKVLHLPKKTTKRKLTPNKSDLKMKSNNKDENELNVKTSTKRKTPGKDEIGIGDGKKENSASKNKPRKVTTRKIATNESLETETLQRTNLLVKRKSPRNRETRQ